jgi:hypothetical protein
MAVPCDQRMDNSAQHTFVTPDVLSLRLLRMLTAVRAQYRRCIPLCGHVMLE